MYRKERSLQETKTSMCQYSVGVPTERIALDILGPLPLSNEGNKYILVVSHYFSISEYPESCAQTKVITLNHLSSKKCADYCPTSTIRRHGRTLQQDTCNTVGLVVDSMVSRHLGEVLVYGGDLNNMEIATWDRWPWRRGQCDNTSPVRLVCLPFGQKMTPDLSRTRSLSIVINFSP